MTPTILPQTVMQKDGSVNLFAIIGVGLTLTLIISQLYLIRKQLRQIDEQKIISLNTERKQIELEHNLRTLLGKDYQELQIKK